jgi:hypothetical protein
MTPDVRKFGPKSDKIGGPQRGFCLPGPFKKDFATASRVINEVVLGWLPFIGWIFSLYRLFLATVGIREMHSTTTGRALLVVLLPAILILVLVLVVVGASAIVFFRAA